MEKIATTEASVIHCTLWRRLAAISYDSMLLFCIVFVAWQPVPLLPKLMHPGLDRTVRLGYLILICFLFFGWFWRHGGQTLGMRAWRIKLVYVSASPDVAISWRSAWIRYIYACISWVVLGTGYLWSLFHPEKFTWHDIMSQTKLIVTPKVKNQRGTRTGD